MDEDELTWVVIASFAIGFTAIELLRAARPIPYKRAVPADLLGYAFYQLAVFPLAVMVCEPAVPYMQLPRWVFEGWVPLAIRVLMFYLAADLGAYWLHRLLHTRPFWRMHAYHHSPTAMWWLAGARATVPQQIVFNIPYIVFIPLLGGAPGWLFFAIVVEGIFRNNWMHMNVTWRSNWIEAVFVTPRYHHIHHSVDTEHHDANFGALFSIWDRLFGTYRDPDKTTPRQFGTGGAKTHMIRLMIGL